MNQASIHKDKICPSRLFIGVQPLTEGKSKINLSLLVLSMISHLVSVD